jgi:hypothetical protein
MLGGPAASFDLLLLPFAEAPKFSSRKTKADLDGLTDEQQVGPITVTLVVTWFKTYLNTRQRANDSHLLPPLTFSTGCRSCFGHRKAVAHGMLLVH